jgi:hypothetical protein
MVSGRGRAGLQKPAHESPALAARDRGVWSMLRDAGVVVVVGRSSTG